MSLTVDHQLQGDVAVMSVTGAIDADTAIPLLRSLRDTIKQRDHVDLDLAAVPSATTAGAAALAEALELAKKRGCTLRVTAISPGLQASLSAFPAQIAPSAAPRGDLLADLGGRVLAVWQAMVGFTQLLADTAYWGLIAPLRLRFPPPGSTTEQAVRIGVTAVPIVCLTAFLLGLILTFLGAYQLRQFGGDIYVANLVGLGIVRELGPVMTAILVAGRSGSAIAAELGTMTVGEEIDALRTMGIDPVRYLIIPRVYAISLTLPVLTLFSMFVGVLGGLVIAMLYLDLGAMLYIKQTLQSLSINDLVHGLSKSLIFAWVIVLSACYYGVRIEGGAAGVGRATVLSVVTSIFSIIIVDSLWATAATVLR